MNNFGYSNDRVHYNLYLHILYNMNSYNRYLCWSMFHVNTGYYNSRLLVHSLFPDILVDIDRYNSMFHSDIDRGCCNFDDDNNPVFDNDYL